MPTASSAPRSGRAMARDAAPRSSGRKLPAAQPTSATPYVTEIAQTWLEDEATTDLTSLGKTLVHYVATLSAEDKATLKVGLDAKTPTGTFAVPAGVRVSCRDDQGQAHDLPNGGAVIIAREAWFGS